MMAKPPIARLPADERRQLLDDLNYLNMGEIKRFCARHSIPYRIAIEASDGARKKTSENDRKGVVLERVRHFLTTGEILEETCFRATVVRLAAPRKQPGPNDRLFYGQYDKTNRAMVALLKKLTNGEYRNGAIARILARDFWSRGEAPTFKKYAAAWLQAVKAHTSPNAEWAFLSDRSRGTAGSHWKRLRANKAAKVLKTLGRISGGSL
jgi:hypothetical protein